MTTAHKVQIAILGLLWLGFLGLVRDIFQEIRRRPEEKAHSAKNRLIAAIEMDRNEGREERRVGR